VKSKRKQFFFEKKNQKTFANGGQHPVRKGQSRAAGESQKFFGSFFQKRTAFFIVCLALAGCGKIGDPSPPGPQDQIIYPKIYPTK
jgi:hypothetical protein